MVSSVMVNSVKTPYQKTSTSAHVCLGCSPRDLPSLLTCRLNTYIYVHNIEVVQNLFIYLHFVMIKKRDIVKYINRIITIENTVTIFRQEMCINSLRMSFKFF